MSQKVLVVDDDPDVRLFSVTVLEENGYTPLEAEDGESGLKKIKSEKPDLVILDFDGTLVDTRDDIVDGVNQALADLGLRLADGGGTRD